MTCLSPALRRRCREETEVLRALSALGAAPDEMIVHAQTDWASITFSGVRHQLTYAFDGASAVDRGEGLIARLDEHDWKIAGQLVADARVLEVEQRVDPPRLVVDLEILLIEEA